MAWERTNRTGKRYRVAPHVPMRQTLNDFGAGIGAYGHVLQSIDPTLRGQWTGYDGAGTQRQQPRRTCAVSAISLARSARIPRPVPRLSAILPPPPH